MKFIELIKKYKVYVLGGLLLIFFFRSCGKSTEARKLGNNVTHNEMVIDSLENVINTKNMVIKGFPETLRVEKIIIHSEYDNYISKKDRGEQLMEIHMMIKDNLKQLQNVK